MTKRLFETTRRSANLAAHAALALSLLAAPAVAQEAALPEMPADAGNAAAGAVPVAAAPAGANRENPIAGQERTPEMAAAVEKGLAYLASQQQADGSFGGGGMGSEAAVTALAGIAFMSAGHMPGRGIYGENVQRAADYIVANAQESGLLAGGQSHGLMYAHGFAALFLAEVYGMTHDVAVKEKLQKAIRLIMKTQNDEGGWRYQPAPLDADVSVTICQVMALRAARDAGIKVDAAVIDKAIEYVKACQNADGGFSYMLRGGGGSSAFPRSAAGVATLFYAGIYEGEEVENGLQYVRQFMPGDGRLRGQRGMSHYFYGHYYAVQCMFLAGGDQWAAWYPAIREELLARQNVNTGSWSGEVNEAYCTAMALIILQMPNRYLPVFAGKGAGG